MLFEEDINGTVKREESQGRKSNSIDYQPNHCLHHNVTFFFFLVTCRLSKVLLCQQVFSHSDIPFLEYLTWIPMATQVRLWTFVTIDCVGFAFYFILNTSFSWK